MLVGMIFNLFVAIPLVLMVIQFARVKPGNPPKRSVARRPEEVWRVYERTMMPREPEPEPARPLPVRIAPVPRSATSTVPVRLTPR